MDRKRRPGPKHRRDWAGMFAKRKFELTRGVDYGCSHESMAQQVRNAASIFGHSVSVRRSTGGIEVEVVEVS